ncbi:hypothetical protein RQP54_18930 [Curvibacter sp. APW13]|uniref:hypothetical protein n=1 Tax=Curvibacter sp. APW13 TaxID=3077236 RepID=UPI0028DEC34B|nr:hypothetical protein [Curvibacter sp. APW13]MDT8992955.1 hypothetical protein [Curvibacter sp. APW13]
MPAADVTPALRDLRQQLPRLVAHTDEPHAEALALVWGSRFDQDHARSLAGSAGLSLPPLEQAAREFDVLPGAAQQRLRALILRHHRWWENAATLH